MIWLGKSVAENDANRRSFAFDAEDPDDPDLGWEIPLGAGPSGMARKDGKSVIVRLNKLRQQPRAF
jgi:hypothetical protein